MAETVDAGVQTGPRRIEIRQIARPREPGIDEALLAVEGNGMCGTDWEQYKGALTALAPFPVIPGHETVGRVVAMGDRARDRLGVTEGDRVAVESTVSCGACTYCARGQDLFCQRRSIYGLTTMTNEPALSGGYAELMVLRSNTRVYPIPNDLSIEDAVFFNPLGAGLDWTVRIGGTTVGDTVVILGPGQRGLASVIAANEAGASRIIVVGRGRRPWKFDLALELGATHVVDNERVNVEDAVLEITDGALADRVIDTTPLAVEPMFSAMRVARAEATVVLAALKEPKDVAGFTDLITAKALTVKGAHSVSDWAKRQAIRILSAGHHDLSRLHTHTLPIRELDLAMRILGGEVDGEEPLHITVTPETGTSPARQLRNPGGSAGVE